MRLVPQIAHVLTCHYAKTAFPSEIVGIKVHPTTWDLIASEVRELRPLTAVETGKLMHDLRIHGVPVIADDMCHSGFVLITEQSFELSA